MPSVRGKGRPEDEITQNVEQSAVQAPKHHRVAGRDHLGAREPNSELFGRQHELRHAADQRALRERGLAAELLEESALAQETAFVGSTVDQIADSAAREVAAMRAEQLGFCGQSAFNHIAKVAECS